jgi:rubredoxin
VSGQAPGCTHETVVTGSQADLKPSSRLECKVCWHVYDPSEGDAAWQVPPGTPFSALPAHWTCPDCSTPKDGFMLLTDDD